MENPNISNKVYKSRYFLRLLKEDYNPFTPNIITMNEDFVLYRRRNWFLISIDSTKIHFQNVVGINIDKHLFGASIKFVTTGEDVLIHGFTKNNANEIEKYCSKFVHSNSRKGTTDVLRKTIVTTSETSTHAIVSAVDGSKNAIVSAVDGSKSSGVSVADELNKLKELLDIGILTQEEFDNQKNKLIS